MSGYCDRCGDAVCACYESIRTGRYDELKAENAALKARIKEMEEQEPVAEKSVNGMEWAFANTVHDFPIGTKLYAAPTTAMLDKARDEENEKCAELVETTPYMAPTTASAIRAIKARREK